MPDSGQTVPKSAELAAYCRKRSSSYNTMANGREIQISQDEVNNLRMREVYKFATRVLELESTSVPDILRALDAHRDSIYNEQQGSQREDTQPGQPDGSQSRIQNWIDTLPAPSIAAEAGNVRNQALGSREASSALTLLPRNIGTNDLVAALHSRRSMISFIETSRAQSLEGNEVGRTSSVALVETRRPTMPHSPSGFVRNMEAGNLLTSRSTSVSNNRLRNTSQADDVQTTQGVRGNNGPGSLQNYHPRCRTSSLTTGHKLTDCSTEETTTSTAATELDRLRRNFGTMDLQNTLAEDAFDDGHHLSDGEYEDSFALSDTQASHSPCPAVPLYQSHHAGLHSTLPLLLPHDEDFLTIPSSPPGPFEFRSPALAVLRANPAHDIYSISQVAVRDTAEQLQRMARTARTLEELQGAIEELGRFAEEEMEWRRL